MLTLLACLEMLWLAINITVANACILNAKFTLVYHLLLFLCFMHPNLTAFSGSSIVLRENSAIIAKLVITQQEPTQVQSG